MTLGRVLALACVGLLACRSSEPEPAPTREAPVIAEPAPATTGEPAASEAESGDHDESDESETGDPRTGEQAHVIPFADRTSMGYLLLLPASKQPPVAPTREQLATRVQQAFPDRRRDGEIDLLLTMIATEPHTTELGGFDLDVPSLDETGGGTSSTSETGEAEPSVALGEDELLEQAAQQERERIFDLIGLHIELIRVGVGDEDVIPSAAMTDPVLTRGLEPAERESLPGRAWALLLRADYRNQHGVRGLRLLQTLVRVVAEREHALIHDPDTLETMNLATFEQRRLRVAAGNVGDQLAIVPFEDPLHPGKLRMTTRGMRRFGAVDLELDGLPAEPIVLQQASDLLAGLALVLVREGEVDVSGFAVLVPDEIEVDMDAVAQTYDSRPAPLARCTGCPGRVLVHLVERPSEDHDPEDHVVARVVAPREQSDAPDYDHPQWALGTLARLFGSAGPAAPDQPTDSP
ncbi:hypothetical protein ACNOYE_10020 [Nannocystaceae bacterium ST9]